MEIGRSIGPILVGMSLACVGVGSSEPTGPHGVQGVCDATEWTQSAQQASGGANAVLLGLVLREADRKLTDPEARAVLEPLMAADELARPDLLEAQVSALGIAKCPLLRMMREAEANTWRDDVGYLCHLKARCPAFEMAQPRTFASCIADARDQNEFGDTMARVILALDPSDPHAFKAAVRQLADEHGVDKCPLAVE